MGWSTDNTSKLVVAFLAFGWIIIWLAGEGYRGLRFIATYEVTTTTIEECSMDYSQTEHSEGYKFSIELKGIEYPIVTHEGAAFRTSLFRKPPPKFDWCTLIGESVTVYHSKAARGGIVFKEPPQYKLDLPQLVSRWGGSGVSGGAWLGVVILAIVCIITVVASVRLFLSTARKEFTQVRIPARRARAAEVWAKYFNDLVVPFVTWALASMLAVLFGLILVKGMLYVETRFSFVVGLIVLTGLGLILVAPAGLFRLIYWIKTTKSQIVRLASNLLTVAAVVPLSLRWHAFLRESDFNDVSDAGILAFLYEVLASIFT